MPTLTRKRPNVPACVISEPSGHPLALRTGGSV